MKPMSQRQSRVAEEVRHAVATALLRGDIPATFSTRFLTIVDVWVSADLSLARLFLQGPEDIDPAELAEAANAQLSKNLRKNLAQAVRLKKIPELVFFPADNS